MAQRRPSNAVVIHLYTYILTPLSCYHTARRWGRRSIWLSVDPSNAAAIQLYRGQGFELVQEPLWVRVVRQRRDLFMYKRVPPYPEGMRACYVRSSERSETDASREAASAAESEYTSSDPDGGKDGSDDRDLALARSDSEFARGATQKKSKVYNWSEEE